MSNRLMAYVRVKPLDNQNSIIDIVDDKTLIFDPIATESQLNDVHIQQGEQARSIRTRNNKNSNYIFDGVFDDQSNNHNIFETVTKEMVDALIDGYNCSVFAYGATGSGKTYTMLGKPNEPGVIHYTTRDLFEKLAITREKDTTETLKICYFEIYNEKVRDLLPLEPSNFIRCGNKRLRTTPDRCRTRQQGHLRDASNLPVCEAPGDGHSLVIPHLTYHRPQNADQLMELLEAGNANRSQHPTDANADSSRSHAIFQIILTRRIRRLNTNNDNNPSVLEYELQTSKMSLIDLAGSERASAAYRPGNNRSKYLQREGANINKSLLALGKCMNALADPKKSHGYIPYRDSKLTRLLADSLGGRCRTAMIATVCQQTSHYDDTQNTLTYASRAKSIRIRPERNFTRDATQACGFHQMIQELNVKLTALQNQNEQQQQEIHRLCLQTQQHHEKLTTLQTKYEQLQGENDRLHHDKEAAGVTSDASAVGLPLTGSSESRSLDVDDDISIVQLDQTKVIQLNERMTKNPNSKTKDSVPVSIDCENMDIENVNTQNYNIANADIVAYRPYEPKPFNSCGNECRIQYKMFRAHVNQCMQPRNVVDSSPYSSGSDVPMPGNNGQHVAFRRGHHLDPPPGTVITVVKNVLLTQYGCSIVCRVNQESREYKIEHYDYWQCLNSFTSLFRWLSLLDNYPERRTKPQRTLWHRRNFIDMRDFVYDNVRHQPCLGLDYQGELSALPEMDFRARVSKQLRIKDKILQNMDEKN